MRQKDRISSIRLVGQNGAAIYIPAAVMREWKAKIGDDVSIDIRDGDLIIRNLNHDSRDGLAIMSSLSRSVGGEAE